MTTKNLEVKENATIKSEPQSKSNRDIIQEIINLIAENNLSIIDARDILKVASRKLGNQKITSSSL